MASQSLYLNFARSTDTFFAVIHSAQALIEFMLY